jgi:hypothetical protein
MEGCFHSSDLAIQGYLHRLAARFNHHFLSRH